VLSNPASVAEHGHLIQVGTYIDAATDHAGCTE
jgi:hypothetical protein